MRFEIESKSWFHFLLCQHNASGAIMQVVNMSSGAIHLKTNTYIAYIYGSVSAGREKWPFNILFFFKNRASV